MADNFAFVMNVASLDEESYELVPGHVLRRAVREEIEVIKETLVRLAGLPLGYFGRFPWEEERPTPVGRPIQMLPETRWRYFVIGFSGLNDVLGKIQQVLDLAPTELEVGFTKLTDRANTIYHPERLFLLHRAAEFNSAFFVDVVKSEIEQIRSVYALFHREDPELRPARLAAGRLADLKSLPQTSSLRVLGYFAVLESLLTHAPKAGDPYDAITRQIKKKLALLENRLTTRLDYSPFAGAAAEKVWSKMYEYRSQIAHGGTPSFKGDLQLLVSDEHALRLIKEATKAVIRQALVEPKLVLDLRDC